MFNGGRLPSKHHVLGHDGDTLRMNGTQVGVLKQSNKVSFQSLLEGKNSRALEMTVCFEILSNLSYQMLEWRLANQKVSRLLVSPDLSKLP
jgi:histone H3